MQKNAFGTTNRIADISISNECASFGIIFALKFLNSGLITGVTIPSSTICIMALTVASIALLYISIYFKSAKIAGIFVSDALIGTNRVIPPDVACDNAECHSRLTKAFAMLSSVIKRKKCVHFTSPSFILPIILSPGEIDHLSKKTLVSPKCFPIALATGSTISVSLCV